MSDGKPISGSPITIRSTEKYISYIYVIRYLINTYAYNFLIIKRKSYEVEYLPIPIVAPAIDPTVLTQ